MQILKSLGVAELPGGTIFTFAVVFAAVVMVLCVAWAIIRAAGLAESEARNFKMTLRADGSQKAPLERFISPGRLFALQLTLSSFVLLLLPTAFFLCGFANFWLPPLFGIGAGFATWNLVKWYYVRKVAKRQRAFELAILDFVTGIAGALKAGMAFPQALERITARMKNPMREELEIVQSEHLLNLEMPDAFSRLVERMPCEDMVLFTAALRLTTRTGGSLADVLAQIGETIRKRREFSEKVRVLTAQGKLEGIVLAAMPVIAFVIFFFLQPEIMMTLFTTTVGWTALGVMVVLEVLGFLSISKITRIEV